MGGPMRYPAPPAGAGRAFPRLASFLRAAAAALVLTFGAAACGGGSGEAPGDGGSSPEAGERPAAEAPAGAPAGGTADAGGEEARDAGAGESGGIHRTTRIQVGGHAVTAEIADTPELRRRGLMHRDSLPEDHGMLFVYPESRILSFWMVNTRIALDIAFINRNGVIVDIQRMDPQSDEQHTSREEAMYALEMAAGWFEEHGVEVGDRVEL